MQAEHSIDVTLPVHDEDKCKYVSTVGLALVCDQVPIFRNDRILSYHWDFNNKPNSLIYVQGNHLLAFLSICKQFRHPFGVVVTGDDMSWPHDPDYFSNTNISQYIETVSKECPNLRVIFAQNAATQARHKLSNIRLVSIPIGLDYHSLNWVPHLQSWNLNCGTLTASNQEAELLECIRKIKPLSKVNPAHVVTNFHLAMNDPPRRKIFREPVYKALQKVSWMTFLDSQQRVDFWMSLNDVAFCLCPPGNGFDTHRTWEVLALGRIPIIEKLPINDVFKDLPVWEVDNWQRFANYSVVDLQNKYNDILAKMHNKKYNMNKVTLKYWETFMRETLASTAA